MEIVVEFEDEGAAATEDAAILVEPGEKKIVGAWAGAAEIVVGFEDARNALIEDAVIPAEPGKKRTVGAWHGAAEIVAVLKSVVGVAAFVDVETATEGAESVEALKIVGVAAGVVDEAIVAFAAVVIAAAFEEAGKIAAASSGDVGIADVAAEVEIAVATKVIADE